MKHVWGSIKGFCKEWDRFWFSSDGTKQMRYFRFAFALTLFCAYSVRTFDLSFFFSNHGILRLSAVSEVMPVNWRYSLFQYFTSETMLYVLNAVFLLSLLLLGIGILPRLCALVALILQVSFVHRNVAITYGMDSVATYFLFYICLFEIGYSKKPNSIRLMLGSAAFRLAQVQICIIYMYSGVQKLRGLSWWRGDALWGVLANYQLARWNFEWVSAAPVLLALFCYLTLLWELYFAALVWFKSTRHIVLWAGVFMHLGIGIALNLPFFAPAMLCLYLLFLNSAELDRVRRFFLLPVSIISQKLKSQ